MDYYDFIKGKHISIGPCGFDVAPSELNENAFQWQKDIIRWMLKKGRCEGWEDCGLGKTLQQLEWSKQVSYHENTAVLILAPLAVVAQTKKEGAKFGIPVNVAEMQSDVVTGINITNYEKLAKFEIKKFGGIALDESSILKSHTSRTREEIIRNCQGIPYRTGWSATPAPNDFMEIGNHAEFLGVMGRSEMLSTFFVHDGKDTSKWRLKGHAEDKFWEWIASWAVVMQKPSDLGYDDDGYDLPPLNIHEHKVADDDLEDEDGQMLLFSKTRKTLNERRMARRSSIAKRVEKAAEIANSADGQVLVWCDLNDESDLLTKSIKGAVEVKGADTDAHKVGAMSGFANGHIRVLVSKPSIAGWGMNWQNCHNEIFVGLSDSYEAWYQAVRRCWRFGQKNPVEVHMVIADSEGAVRENIRRKHAENERMTRSLISHTKNILSREVRGAMRISEGYRADEKIKIPGWIGA